VVDITHQNAQAQAEAVLQTLAEIEADHIPIVTVLNKIDHLADPEKARRVVESFPNATAISALTGEGVPDLLKLVSQQLFETYAEITVRLPYSQGNLISLFHEYGQVERLEHEHGGVLIQGKVPGRLVARYQPFTRLASVPLSEDGQESLVEEDLEVEDYEDGDEQGQGDEEEF
jgi:GTP-binding protein HflX